MSRRTHLLLPALWLVGLYLGAIGAGFFAPFDYAEQNRAVPFAPPTRLHLVDPQGRIHARPFVCQLSPRPDFASYSEDCSHRFPLDFLVTGAPYRFLGLFESRRHLFGVTAPGAIYLMGTDDFGRDQFARFLYGARTSLFSGLLACAICLTLGVLLGTLAGYYRGPTDICVSGASDFCLALPWLYLLIAARALLPLNAAPSTALVIVTVIIGVVGWAQPARLIRSAVLTATEREYVAMSRSFGRSDLQVLRAHIAPQIGPVVGTQAFLLIPRFVLAEAVLSFLGLGINEPAPSWGTMLGRLQDYSVLTSYWWMFIPVFLLVPTFLSFGALASLIKAKPDADSLGRYSHAI